jgi:Protein of unknown function (DUF1244)
MLLSEDLFSFILLRMYHHQASTMTANNYIEQHFPPSVTQQLEAGAFQMLCTHLKERSDEVQNIDLMTVSGFCRNCLAKASTGMLLLLRVPYSTV